MYAESQSVVPPIRPRMGVLSEHREERVEGPAPALPGSEPLAPAEGRVEGPASLEIPETAPFWGTSQNSYTAKDLGPAISPLESALTRNSRIFHISFKIGHFKSFIISTYGFLCRKSFIFSTYIKTWGGEGGVSRLATFPRTGRGPRNTTHAPCVRARSQAIVQRTLGLP